MARFRPRLPCLTMRPRCSGYSTARVERRRDLARPAELAARSRAPGGKLPADDANGGTAGGNLSAGRVGRDQGGRPAARLRSARTDDCGDPTVGSATSPGCWALTPILRRPGQPTDWHDHCAPSLNLSLNFGLNLILAGRRRQYDPIHCFCPIARQQRRLWLRSATRCPAMAHFPRRVGSKVKC